MLVLAMLACTSGDTSDTIDTTDSPVDDCTADADADGSNACDDCDDDDPGAFPGAAEACDGVDADCDGTSGESEDECAACADAGFYDLLFVDDDQLLEALTDATDRANCTYDRSRREMFSGFDNVDGEVTCVYTGRTYAATSYPPDDWRYVNTEHTWPQSMGADLDPAQCDLHHLYPVDVEVNATRGNLPFGEVVSVEASGDADGGWSGSLLGDDAQGTRVFEPRDSHKGNVARSMLYFRVRYDGALPGDALAAFASADDYAIYATWDALDPVDDAELARTAEIADYQDHPNPFVVCPGLVDRFVESQR